MRKPFFIFMILAFCFLLSCANGSASENNESTAYGGTTVKITANGKTFTAALLKNGPLTLRMDDYAGMEKNAELPATLPRNDERIDAEAGDLILYLGRIFVIYYSTNSYSLTRLGKINGATAQEIRAALGKESVEVKIEL